MQSNERLLLPISFSSKLTAAFATSQLCVGIDPHESSLIEAGLEISPQGLETFSRTLLAQSVGRAKIVKPQVSFFERFGSAGFMVLEKLCREATEAGMLVIADAKRGDIGTTMAAYGSAWLGQAAPFLVDALTVSPYLGFDSLHEIAALASERGKAIIVLCATSNPEATKIQSAQIADQTVAATIWQDIAKLNRVISASANGFGNIGAVIGATVNLSAVGLGAEVLDNSSSSAAVMTPVLAPGFGFQGAKLSQAREIFGALAPQTMFSVSRSLLEFGLENAGRAIDAANAELGSKHD